MSDALTWRENTHMVYAQTTNHIFGFGKRNLTMDQLITEIQSLGGRQISWVHLKQTHSNVILESRSEHASRDEALLREGDAHFCTSRNVGLLVKTADCLPVLMFAEDQILSVAVHAGWRGIANEILRETVRALSHRGVKPEKLYVVIGPHIRQKSFEVDEDVARQLERTAERASPRDSGRLREIVKLGTSADGSLRKYFVDLEQVAVEQLAAEGILRNRIHTCRCWNLGASLSAGAFDTKTQPDWASYRRDGKSAGRNLSFIAQL